ncbi:hypothetical protein HDV05_007746 [Chytridiales sp. JEL 0842]|nr:hypothetical protein HDV05_007746 [Chytridiales sp. JEL 0842]
MQDPHKRPTPKPASRKKKGIRAVGSDEDYAAGPSIITAPSPSPQRAVVCSTAENYDFVKLLPLLQRRYVLMPYLADDVLHIRLPALPTTSNENNETKTAESQNEGLSTEDSNGGNTAVEPEAFFFQNGTFVTWGASDAQIDRLLELVSKVALQPYSLSSVESDWFEYYEDGSQDVDRHSGITSDTILIGSDLPPSQSKLAFSSALVRSAKLSSLETVLDSHLSKHREIPSILLSGKKLPLGRAQVLRYFGVLYSLRFHVNLHSELLDSPDFCWSNTKMESLFERLCRHLDVKPRISIVNKKLDYASELADLLRNHLHEEHSLKLEWCIIVLIAIEIGFECVHYWDRYREGKKAEEEAAKALALAQDGVDELGVERDVVFEKKKVAVAPILTTATKTPTPVTSSVKVKDKDITTKKNTPVVSEFAPDVAFEDISKLELSMKDLDEVAAEVLEGGLEAEAGAG